MEIQTKFNGVKEISSHVVSFKARIERYMSEFKSSSTKHSECLDNNDYLEFNAFAESLMQETKEKMDLFLQEKYKKKTERISYEIYEANAKFKKLMDEVMIVEDYLKQNDLNQLKKRIMGAERMSELYYDHNKKKRGFLIWKNNVKDQTRLHHNELKAENYYESNLLKRFIMAWRCFSYKSGFRVKVKKESKFELQNIESEYLKIMANLHQKIKDTEELVQIKRNAKNEFAYSLNRDILKTISNLSMEVMTLSQVTLKDNLPENTDNLIFMDKLRSMIDGKLKNMSTTNFKLTEKIEISKVLK